MTVKTAETIIKDFNRNCNCGYSYDDNLFVKRLKDDGFNNEEIAKIINNINNICLSCFDNDKGCQCWNDE